MCQLSTALWTTEILLYSDPNTAFLEKKSSLDHGIFSMNHFVVLVINGTHSFLCDYLTVFMSLDRTAM